MNTSTLNYYRFWAYLQLLRPANIITAWADIMAGFAASGYFGQFNVSPLLWLLLATTGLYGGGIVFNDVFDADLDAKERPERPIPSGRASRSGASLLGGSLLIAGVAAAVEVSWLSAVLALAIATSALLYDAFGKHHPIFGPINMGFCRGGNLLLGVSVVPVAISDYWFLGFIPIVYIAAITALSRGEVQGGKSSTGMIALLLITAVMVGLLGLGCLTDYQVLTALPFLVLLAIRVLIPFINATRQPTPEQIRIAVRAGVLSLIILDTTLAAGFAGLPYGLLVLSLLPLSMILSQIFAVT